MSKLAEMRTKYKQLIEDAKKLTPPEGQELSKEASDKITALLGQADETKVQIDMLARVEAGDKFATEPGEPKAANLSWRNAGPDEGAPPVDAKAFRKFEIPVATPWGVERKEFRFSVPLAVQGKGYEPAFEAYMRKGIHSMGGEDRKALSEGLDASGGFLVPEDMQTQILKKLATMAIVRQYARVITTSRDIVKWPRVKYATDNQYTSAIRLTWTGETPASASTHRVTDQVFGEFSIPVHTAMASQLISMDLIADSAFDVLGISSDLFAEAFALGEEDAFWGGSGANQPRGILTDAADTTNFNAAVNTAQSASSAIEAEDVITLIYALPAQYERGARVFMTKATEKVIRSIKDADSDYIWPVQSLVGGFGVAANELLGFPTTRAEFMDEAGDGLHPLVFGNLEAYAVVDRAGLSVQRFDDLYAETNQVLLLGKKRVGGQLVESYKLSLLKTVTST